MGVVRRRNECGQLLVRQARGMEGWVYRGTHFNNANNTALIAMLIHFMQTWTSRRDQRITRTPQFLPCGYILCKHVGVTKTRGVARTPLFTCPANHTLLTLSSAVGSLTVQTVATSSFLDLSYLFWKMGLLG